MVGKAFPWKVVTDSTLTAAIERPFQRGMTTGKKREPFICITVGKDIMSELMRVVGAIASMS